MLIRGHEVFVLPSRRLTLWRYMDFTKFIALLEDQALVFPRVDQFDDPYEAHLSEAAVQLIRSNQTGFDLKANQSEAWIRFPHQLRQRLFVSCWCASEHESAAMWKLYLTGAAGVAIRTTSDLLAKELDACDFTVGVSQVKYIDYRTTPIPLDNALFPVMHKRLSFSHENELRAVIWSEITGNDSLIQPNATLVSVPIAVQNLIQAVHVDPTAPKWFGTLVERVVTRYGLSVPVVRSGLYDRPAH